MARILCHAVGGGPTGCMRVTTSRRVDFLRWTPPSLVCPLTAEDEPEGDNCGETTTGVESKGDSATPGSTSGVHDRGVSISFEGEPTRNQCWV